MNAGEVSNTKAVIEQVKTDAIKAGTRYFALGTTLLF
jgi:hypothetical protein